MHADGGGEDTVLCTLAVKEGREADEAGQREPPEGQERRRKERGEVPPADLASQLRSSNCHVIRNRFQNH
uniref:Uncharacterized protein n=1 Tax=Oryza sativa subsp. japonica TaxID=39947 RepID=Q6K254_ORYSJ|nr:hypothetical protein [Oryza sativa Japonica Group]BAD26127.1 hypothetical protein [Oryza sativa Japonica Group]